MLSRFVSVPILLTATSFAAWAASPWFAPAASAPQINPKETEASSVLQLADQKLSVAYRTSAWNHEMLARARGNAGQRDDLNRRLPFLTRATLSLPFAMQVGGISLKAGDHPLRFEMNNAGVLVLRVLVDKSFQTFDYVPQTSPLSFPFLCMNVVPSEAADCELVVQWGTETGRLRMRRSAQR